MVECSSSESIERTVTVVNRVAMRRKERWRTNLLGREICSPLPRYIRKIFRSILNDFC